MVTMFRGPRWKIAVYGRDHGVPHFHIEGPDFRCSVAIASFDVIVGTVRSEEHTSELQSLMRISYAVFCLKKKIHMKPATNVTKENSKNQSENNKYHTPSRRVQTES